jgi:molecular chaperone DnaK
MEGSDANEIRRLSEELTQASHKLAEAMYQQASGAAGAQQVQVDRPALPVLKGEGSTDDDVVDADFEEVKEDKK